MPLRSITRHFPPPRLLLAPQQVGPEPGSEAGIARARRRNGLWADLLQQQPDGGDEFLRGRNPARRQRLVAVGRVVGDGGAQPFLPVERMIGMRLPDLGLPTP